MDKIRDAVSEIVSHEIKDDKRVVPDGFIISPFMMGAELEGDGNEEEISTAYQVDIFYTTKSELIRAAKSLRKKLKAVCESVSDWSFMYEGTVKLWRGFITVRKLEVSDEEQ